MSVAKIKVKQRRLAVRQRRRQRLAGGYVFVDRISCFDIWTDVLGSIHNSIDSRVAGGRDFITLVQRLHPAIVVTCSAAIPTHAQVVVRWCVQYQN